MALIEVKNLSVSIHEKEILSNVNLSINEGEVTVLVGPSGSGKTTLLRCLNLLQRPTEGTIKIGNTQIDAKHLKKKDIHLLRKNSSMVFQQFNLFKNMTAVENIMAPLLLNKLATWEDAHSQAIDLLKNVELDMLAEQYPSKLSGGQQQRIAIARAIATKPEVVLLDEPTSALDPELVGSVLQTILRLAEQHITMVIVTHEMKFAKLIADQIVFIEKGEIIHQGNPESVLSEKGPKRVSDFMNSVTLSTLEKSLQN